MSKDQENFNKYINDSRNHLDLARTNLIRVGMYDGSLLLEGYLKSLTGFQKMINGLFNLQEKNCETQMENK